MLPQTFHPIIRNWFIENYGNPTSVQAESWPLIENGENVLALAPTGSGKTLTAFLSAISRFCCEEKHKYDAGKLSVLYVSPLKALNEDIKRNLLIPLAAIKSRFEKEGVSFPPVRVETRSGDTPQSARRRFFSHPPSILALTPESLAIILLNPKGRQVLSNVKYLIIDEIHALIGNKRGAYLSCQVERLSHIAGEFQRISLSATVRNPQIAADFIGGIKRKVCIVSAPAEKKIDFNIEFPDIIEDSQPVTRYTPIIEYVLKRIFEGSTLLVFAESRRRAERLCYFLNTESSNPVWTKMFSQIEAKLPALGKRGSRNFYPGAVAFTHHGSLSKEMRRSVEKGLAEGRIPCVVATASLELGIDIGDIDEVILAGSTGNVSQALQRIGRSGHSVGETSKGKLFAFHGKDLLTAAVLKMAVDERDIEEIHPIENPQDILAQLILSLCSEKDRDIDELYDLVKNFYIFKNLNFDSYKRVVKMLAGFSCKEGLNGRSRLRDIKPRIWLDSEENKIGVLDGTTTLLYTSSGVIANRGLYSLRIADGTKIGELDEEFVWERRVGDCFDFGARGWRITNISPESVEVTPLDKRADSIPFWKGDLPFRSANLSQKILSILENYNRTECPGVPLHAPSAAKLPQEAENSLKEFLAAQIIAQRGNPLPDSKNIVIEIIKGASSGASLGSELNRDFCSVVLHSFRGGQINYPLSLALSMELEEIVNLRVASFSNDDNILFLIPRLGLEEAGSLSLKETIHNALVSLNKKESNGISRAQRFFRNRLESSGVFGAAFREAAERSMMLPKAPFGKRTPLWIMRQRSKRLFDAVAGEDGFPVTAEAWRSCLIDTFDMEGFNDLISSINDRSVTVSFFQTELPSPFSRDIVREETNTFMYEYDERSDLARSKSATLSDKVIDEAIYNAGMRPALKTQIIDSFVSRLKREIEGYAPDDLLSLYEWVKERIAIPEDEWKTLCAIIPKSLLDEIDPAKIKTITRNSAANTAAEALPCIVHREWEETWINEPLSVLDQWLRYEGPISIERICAVFSVTTAEAEDAVNALVEVDEAVNDVTITTDSSPLQSSNSSLLTANSSLICDRENLEMLLRISRKKERPVIKERPSSVLVPFLALRQGLTRDMDTNHNETLLSDYSQVVFRKNLYAWTAPAKLWETEILYSRNSSYDPEKLNSQIREGNLIWYGSGREKIGFCNPEDLDLTLCSDASISAASKKNETCENMKKLSASHFFDRPRDFWEIKNELASVSANAGGADSRSCAKTLWDAVWEGQLSADSFDPVRRGIEHGFIPKEIDIQKNTDSESSLNASHFGRARRVPSALKNRWKSGAPVHGNWFSLKLDEQNANETTGAKCSEASRAKCSEAPRADPLEEDALNRDRVRLLLSRWGVLCRPLLEHEVSVFSWSKLLPAMRRMELAGELVTGRFFAGINSLQFASPSIAAELEQAENCDCLYWMNAADPASPAGLNIEKLGYTLCARSSSGRLYYKGAELIAVSAKNGKELQILIKTDDPCLEKLIALFKLPRTRKVMPENKIQIEKINEKNAAQSDYAGLFKEQGFVNDRGRLIFW